jgi:hypothetical protein
MKRLPLWWMAKGAFWRTLYEANSPSTRRLVEWYRKLRRDRIFDTFPNKRG